MRYVLAAALAAALVSPALAQPGPSGRGPDAQEPFGPRGGPGHVFEQMTRADFEALADARVAAIQVGLKLNAEQQRLWPAVEQAIRAIAAERIDRVERFRSGQRPTPPADFMERLDRRAERMSQRAERLKALQGALKPLWATLDERQKRLLPILMRPAGGHRHGMAWAREHGGMG